MLTPVRSRGWTELVRVVHGFEGIYMVDNGGALNESGTDPRIPDVVRSINNKRIHSLHVYSFADARPSHLREQSRYDRMPKQSLRPERQKA